MSVKKGFLSFFMCMAFLHGSLMIYILCYANDCAELFNVRFHWDTKNKQDLNQAVIGTIIVLGMTIGAISGGKLMTVGRRVALIICDIIGIIGASITMDFQYPVILCGRFILGLSAGLISSIVPRYIEDTVPNHYHYLMATIFYIS